MGIMFAVFYLLGVAVLLSDRECVMKGAKDGIFRHGSTINLSSLGIIFGRRFTV